MAAGRPRLSLLDRQLVPQALLARLGGVEALRRFVVQSEAAMVAEAQARASWRGQVTPLRSSSWPLPDATRANPTADQAIPPRSLLPSH